MTLARKAWGQDEVLCLEEYVEQGLSDRQIAKRLGRSVNSVHVFCSRHVRKRSRRPMSTRSVAEKMGVKCSKAVVAWIDRGWLRARRTDIGAGRCRRWAVTEDALLDFIALEAAWHTWKPGQIRDAKLREWAQDCRGAVRFLSVGEVGRRFSVGPAAVNKWIHDGLLPAHRWGNWWIRESDLEGIVAPCQVSKKGTRARRFTPAEDARLLAMRRAGRSWRQIARALGRALGSVAQRYERLQQRQEQVA